MRQDMYFWLNYTEKEILAAIRFYENSPDGQYDRLAVDALKFLLEIRRRDMGEAIAASLNKEGK